MNQLRRQHTFEIRGNEYFSYSQVVFLNGYCLVLTAIVIQTCA